MAIPTLVLGPEFFELVLAFDLVWNRLNQDFDGRLTKEPIGQGLPRLCSDRSGGVIIWICSEGEEFIEG